MSNGDVLSESEEVELALRTLQKYGKSRGDSFDIGRLEEMTGTTDITSLLSNPQQLIGSLNLTPKQAENIASIITGGAAGLGYKYLSKHIGAELAGAVSGFLGGFIAKKVVGK